LLRLTLGIERRFSVASYAREHKKQQNGYWAADQEQPAGSLGSWAIDRCPSAFASGIFCHRKFL
jgi:hypothetical protein